MTEQRLRTKRTVRLLLAGFSIGLGTANAQSPAKAGAVRAAGPDEMVPVARAAMPDDTGYEQYRGANPPANDGTAVGRAWTNVKKWVDDRGTNFSKSFSETNSADNSLMPLSPSAMPQFANGVNGQKARSPATPNQPSPAIPAAQPYARHPQSPPAFNGGPVMAGPQGANVSPTQLAGKPAFNWYGYGSAPPSGYPQGSENWMNQTGATPGAFPVTAQPAMPRQNYVGGPRVVSTIPTIPPPTIAPPPAIPTSSATTSTDSTTSLRPLPTITPAPTAPTMPVYTAPLAPSASTPKSDDPEWQPASRSPQVERMGGKADEGRVVHAVGYETTDSDPIWQTAKVLTPKLIPVPKQEVPPAILPMPIPTAPISMAAITQIPVVDSTSRMPAASLPSPVSIPQQTWQPIPTQTQPVAAQLAVNQPFPKPQPVAQQSVWRQPPPQIIATGRTAAKPQPQMSSGELAPPPPNASVPQVIAVNASRQVLELERQIRTATIRSATILEVNEAGPQKIVVKYVSKTEASAREAAQAISELPALRPYSVDFEVRLVGR